ncbi:hypothetical protein OKW18_002539 [Streptomyces pratensis]|nr:hypothetical protein [Streptomyces pratensis]
MIGLSGLDVPDHLLEGFAAVGEVTILLAEDGDERVALVVRAQPETIVSLAALGLFPVDLGHGETPQS